MSLLNHIVTCWNCGCLFDITTRGTINSDYGGDILTSKCPVCQKENEVRR
jgi:hypothetical protein